MRKLGNFSTFYQDVEVWRSRDEVEFRVAGAVHAWYHSRKYLTGLAWDLIAAAPLLHPAGPPRSVLMLGLAGGTSFRILRHLLPDCRLVAVDIDRELVDLAREHMHLDGLDVTVEIADAHEWLEENHEKFDAVIDDIYLAGSNDVYRPYRSETDNLLRLCSALRPNGILAINLVTGTGHRTIQSQTRSLLRNTFESVRSLKTPGAQNEVLVAGTQVGSGTCLVHYRDQFPCQADREFWSRISNCKLR